MATAELDAAEATQDGLPTAGAIHLNTADGDSEPLKLQSMCMNCHETGTTTMILVSIPHFRELLIASFECPHCDFRNSEVQFAGAYGERGTRHNLTVAKGQTSVLRRQVVKSNWATVSVPELQFEIPPLTQKGVITTVEGLLSEAASNLRQLQEERRQADPAVAAAIDGVLAQLDACAAAERGFTLVMEDPAGCSHVEPGADGDTSLQLETFERSAEQSEAIGLSAGQDVEARSATEEAAEAAPRDQPSTSGQVVELPGHCYACGAGCDTRMFTTAIPHFKDVVIMSNACDACGYRDSEVKPGGGFSDKGRVITLQVANREDLSRDVIKSDTAEVYIAELDLRMSTGTMGGLITTVEGLLTAVLDAFKNMRSFSLGDSADAVQKARYTEFFTKLGEYADVKEPWTLVIRDPLANSFVAALTGDPAVDGRLKVEDFERSAEDDAEFGIDHLKLHDGDGSSAPACNGSAAPAEAQAAS